MNRNMTTFLKKILSKIIPNSSRLRYLAYLPKLNQWIKQHKENYPVFTKRDELYNYINKNFCQNDKITYLEFGVCDGDSIISWGKINTSPNSRFFGFDTFTGIPESWASFSNTPKHSFSTAGKIPTTDDTRISFVQGLFQETLQSFLSTHTIEMPLVIHNDSDLYSSTLFVLAELNKIILPGTIIIFDEFSSILHEFRALEDYCSAYLREYKVISATKSPKDYYSQIAIQFI